MNEGIGKYIGGKVLTAVLGVAAVVVIIWYVRMPEADRAAMWAAIRCALLWIGLAAVLPWATFFVPPRIVRAESNLASALMLAAYLVADAALALYLAGGLPAAPWHRVLLVLGLLCAVVYNFVVCDFIAERADESA